MYEINDSKQFIGGIPNSTFNNFNENQRKIGMSVNSGVQLQEQ